MSDDFKDLRTSLRQSADGFRPRLDASALAETGRARSRWRTIVGSLGATIAAAVAALIVVPFLLRPPAPVPATPAPMGASPSESAPTFDPTRPSHDPTGNESAKRLDSMKTPLAGAVTPDGSWKELTVAEANLRVKYQPNWTVNEGTWGVIWITAPSGYSLHLATNTLQQTCDDGPATPESQIATTDLVAITSLGKGRVVIRWHGGGQSPAALNLAQHSRTKSCWQKFLNYAGVDDAYLGSADNFANPTVNELDEAVAILTSASRVH